MSEELKNAEELAQEQEHTKTDEESAKTEAEDQSQEEEKVTEQEEIRQEGSQAQETATDRTVNRRSAAGGEEGFILGRKRICFSGEEIILQTGGGGSPDVSFYGTEERGNAPERQRGTGEKDLLRIPAYSVTGRDRGDRRFLERQPYGFGKYPVYHRNHSRALDFETSERQIEFSRIYPEVIDPYPQRNSRRVV